MTRNSKCRILSSFADLKQVREGSNLPSRPILHLRKDRPVFHNTYSRQSQSDTFTQAPINCLSFPQWNGERKRIGYRESRYFNVSVPTFSPASQDRKPLVLETHLGQPLVFSGRWTKLRYEGKNPKCQYKANWLNNGQMEILSKILLEVTKEDLGKHKEVSFRVNIGKLSEELSLEILKTETLLQGVSLPAIFYKSPKGCGVAHILAGLSFHTRNQKRISIIKLSQEFCDLLQGKDPIG